MSNEQLCRLIIIVFATLTMSACGSDESKGVDRDNSVVNGVNFVGVSVGDMQSSVDFYTDSVGLELASSQLISSNESFDRLAGRDDVKASSQLMKSTNAQLLFMQFANQSKAAVEASKVEVYGPGIAHVCYQVNEKTKAYQRALAAGATHIGDRELVQLSARNPVKYAYVRDLEERIIEIEHVDVEALNLPEPPKNDYRIRHVSLATADMSRSIKFYSILLDQSKPRRAGRWISLSGDKLDRVSGLPESKIKMVWFQVRNIELEIIQYVSHTTDKAASPRPIDALGYNMIVFDVKNIQEARDKFLEAGGEIVSDVGSLMGGDIVFGRDPDGNLIGLQQADAKNVISSKNFSDNGI